VATVECRSPATWQFPAIPSLAWAHCQASTVNGDRRHRTGRRIGRVAGRTGQNVGALDPTLTLVRHPDKAPPVQNLLESEVRAQDCLSDHFRGQTGLAVEIHHTMEYDSSGLNRYLPYRTDIAGTMSWPLRVIGRLQQSTVPPLMQAARKTPVSVNRAHATTLANTWLV
jgi:hypothetical protein